MCGLLMEDGMSDDAVVTSQSGRGVAYEWAKGNGPATNAWQSQRRRYQNLLSGQCVAESVRLRETEDKLWERLNKAGEVLDAVKYACAFDGIRKYWQVEDVPEVERNDFLKRNEVVWQRHDTNHVYDLGYEEAQYPGVDRKALAHAAAEYLERPWLRVAALDWLLVDAFITDEVVNYGDSLKASYLPGPSDPMEKYRFDRKTKGNVQAILREGRKYKKHPVLTRLGWQIGFPIITVGAAVYFEAWKTAAAFVVLTVLDWGFLIVQLLIWGVRRMRATPEQLLTPEQRDYRRLFAMRGVHRLLEGPVINPTLLREEMVKSKDIGAVWDLTAWAIVDRVIRDDPAVWITSFPAL